MNNGTGLYLCVLYVLTLVYLVPGQPALYGRQVLRNRRSVKQYIEADSTGQINKRAISPMAAAEAAVRQLLNGAKFLTSNGLDSYYIKHGRPTKALEDFHSLHLQTLKESRGSGKSVQMNGDVGDRHFIFRQEKSNTNAVIAVTKPLRWSTGSDLRTHFETIGEKIIIYTE